MSSFGLCRADKRELLEAAKANAMKILGVEKLELPESVKPILSEPECEPEKRVRHGSEKTAAQVSVGGNVTCMWNLPFTEGGAFNTLKTLMCIFFPYKDEGYEEA